MASKRSAKVDYNQLHNFSSVVLYDTKAPRRSRGKFYDVERIIVKRTVRHDSEYLIKWKGWPLETCSWEPSSNLTPDLLRSYERPQKPTDRQLSEASRTLYCAIQTALKSKSVSAFSVDMPLDVWRYITLGKGTAAEHLGHTLLQREDFHRLTPLPSHWWYYLNKHGEGAAVVFPLKVKPMVSWSRKHFIKKEHILCEAPRVPIERIIIGMGRRACDINSV